MLTRIASLLALIPMLMHSILGCCWHHDHACHGAVVATCNVVETVSHGHGSHHGPCDHHADSGDSQAAEHHDHSGSQLPCDEEQCVAAAAALGAVTDPVIPGWCWSESALAINTSSDSIVRTAVHDRAFDERTILSSSQRRALRQVWLV